MTAGKIDKPSFSRCFHVAVVVKDMDQAISRLKEFGIGPFRPHAPPTPMVGKPDYKGELAESEEVIMEARISDDDTYLVLFQPVKGNSPWQDFLDKRGEGFQHVALEVGDLDAEMDKLKERGIESLGGARWEGGGGGFFYDGGLGDTLLELMKE